MTANQLPMFTDGEDLPLFSGTAPKGHVDTFDAGKAEPKQEPLPADCHFCADTGVLSDHTFCWCQAGQQQKRARRQDGILVDARALSSGTLATLTGKRRYDNLDAIHESFILWLVEFDGHYPAGWSSWQHAWTAFWEGYDERTER